jgi:hypothetical protein
MIIYYKFYVRQEGSVLNGDSLVQQVKCYCYLPESYILAATF